MADDEKPIYALWFSKDGLGPDPAIIKVWPVSPMPGKTEDPEDAALGLRFDPNRAPGGFSMGHCPYGAGPLLGRAEVEELHRQLGAWLEATKP